MTRLRTFPRDAARFVQRRGWVVLWLTLVWVLLWGDFSPGNLIAGVIVALLVLVALPLPSVRTGVRLHPWALLVLLGHVAVDLVRSAFEVSRAVLRPHLDPRNAVVEIPLRTHSDLVLTVTSQLLSLVPGSLVLEVDQPSHRLWLHVFDVRQGAGHAETWRRRTWKLEARAAAALGVPSPAPDDTAPPGGSASPDDADRAVDA